MNQLNSRLIIPTHGNGNMDAMGFGSEMWDAYSHTLNEITIYSADLEENTKFVIMGPATDSMQALFDLPVWVQE